MLPPVFNQPFDPSFLLTDLPIYLGAPERSAHWPKTVAVGLKAMLPRVLTNTSVRHRYVTALERVVGRVPRSRRPFWDVQLEPGVLLRGGDHLLDEQLLALACNPARLEALSEMLDRDLPTMWLPQMDYEALQQVRELVPPPIAPARDARALRGASAIAELATERESERFTADATTAGTGIGHCRFLVGADEVVWLSAPPGPKPRQATVRVRWTADGWKVSADSFLRFETAAVRLLVLDRHAERLAERHIEPLAGTPDDDGTIHLPGLRPPRPGDQVHLHHRQQSSDTECCVVLRWPDGSDDNE